MAALAIAAVSCKKAEPVTPSITLSTPTEVTVPTDGGIQTVSFTTNVPWKASIDNSNWTVSPTSGDAGTASLKVTAINNTSNDPVVAKVTIKAETASQTVTFTQLQKDALVADVTSYDAPAEGGTVSVKVNTNVEVTATTDAEWITIPTPTKGLVEKTFDLTVAANDGEAREGSVILSGAGQKVEITVKQAAFVPVFEVDCELFEVSKEGGEFTVNITTNVDFKVTDYHDGSFPWQTATLATDGKTLKVVIDANTGYDVRTSYVKLTVPAIQDPVIDEETGEPTGETKDHTVRVYFGQAGLTQLGWRQEFTWDLYAENSDYSAAVAGEYLLVSTSVGVFAYSKADGKFIGKIELPITPKEITCDDAGNIIAFVGGTYDVVTASPIDPLLVYALPADKLTDPTAARQIIKYMDAFYGYGLGRIRVTGDVSKDACVTMVTGGNTDNYVLAWEVKDGTVEADEDGFTPITDYVGLPFTSSVWSSQQSVAKHLGTTVDSGLFYIGYDDNYNLHFNNSMTGANWQEVIVTGSSWMEGYSSMDYVEWNGHKYIGFIGMTYYPQWGPSYVWIANIDNPSAPVVIAKTTIEQAPDLFCYGSTTDICLEVEDGNLVAYVVESSTACVGKIIYPAK